MSQENREWTTTYYVISSVLGSVLEVTSSGFQRAYVMSGGSVVAQLNPNGQFYWLHLDHLGSGRKMTDTSGTMTYRAEFDPYGKLLYEWSSPTNLNTKKFTGYERDAATNLDYAQARMYGSEWGRFMSPDPRGINSANARSPQSLNRYSYTDNNPVNRVDPSGTEWINIGQACSGYLETRGQTVYYVATCTVTRIWVPEPPRPNVFLNPQQAPVSLPTARVIPPYTGFGPLGDPSITLKINFKNFLENGLSENCRNMIGPWLNELRAKLDSAQIYDLDKVGNDFAKDYLGIEFVRSKGGNEQTTLWGIFELTGSAAANGGATTAWGAPREGIYIQGGAAKFQNSPYFFLHEMMHLIGLSEADLLDKMLIRKGPYETASEAVSRWFNNKCEE